MDIVLSFDKESDLNKIKSICENKVCSLMWDEKVNLIISYIKKYKCKNLIEVGTFAGGTAYKLKKALPDVNVTTIDTNKFKEFLSINHNYHILESVKSLYTEIDIDDSSILKIQKIYKELLPEINFIEGSALDLNVKQYDCVIIDDDHYVQTLNNHLNHFYTNMEKGIIIVDDCIFEHISDICINFCSSNNIPKQNYKFDCYINYNDILPREGNDLFIIGKNMKIE